MKPMNLTSKKIPDKPQRTLDLNKNTRLVRAFESKDARNIHRDRDSHKSNESTITRNESKAELF
jgi:hypothetical protein